MKTANKSIILMVVFLAILLGGCTPATTESTPVQPTPIPVSSTSTPEPLICNDGTFSSFIMTNTKERSYTSGGSTCNLKPEDEGVIWIAIGEGHAISDASNMLIFANGNGIEFKHVCWVDAGKIGGSTVTRMMLAGPEDSDNIEVCCGDSCVHVMVETAEDNSSDMSISDLEKNTALPTNTDLPTLDVTSTPQGPIEYIVQEGDTCESIASKFNVSIESIIQVNNLSSSCELIIGSVVLIIP